MAPPLQPEDTAPEEAREPMADRYIVMLLRLTQIMLIAWIAMEIPLPILDRQLPLKAPLVSLAAVILVGKAVYDTLFYDRFRP